MELKCGLWIQKIAHWIISESLYIYAYCLANGKEHERIKRKRKNVVDKGFFKERNRKIKIKNIK